MEKRAKTPGSSVNRTTNKICRLIKWSTVLFVASVSLLTAVHFPRTVDDVRAAYAAIRATKYRSFYDTVWATSPPSMPTDDPDLKRVLHFVSQHDLHEKLVLEVGAGSGRLQDVVTRYTGLDISAASRKHFHKPFVQASATDMPFNDNTFDAIWTINTLEHVPSPEAALHEMRRVLKNGGLLYLSPAWQCRPWAADGYDVRPFSDFDLKEKVIKAFLPIRNSVPFRALYVFPIRVLRFLFAARPTSFHYNRLNPNYDRFWQSDSDAVNSMDAFEAVLWFTSRGDDCINYPTLVRQMLVKNGPVVIRVNKRR